MRISRSKTNSGHLTSHTDCFFLDVKSNVTHTDCFSVDVKCNVTTSHTLTAQKCVTLILSKGCIWLTRKRLLVGPFSSTVPRALRWS